MSYNKEEASKRFERGKYLLDRGLYEEAILVFSELIDAIDPIKDSDDDALLTWNLSLNNRGVARCELGYSRGDKKLFEEGLNDFRMTVNYEKNVSIREGMTAAMNLRFGEGQLDNFENKKIANIQFKKL